MGEKAVTIATPDGAADAHLYTPAGSGPWPGVIMMTDIFGVRAAFQAMARRLADEGFAVLLPNPYYRVGPAPVPAPAGTFADPAVRERLMALKDALTAERVRTDIGAFLRWLLGRPEVAGTKAGIVGYCMSGGFAIRGAGAFPDRIGAAASFHGGGLATDDPDSPHRVAGAIAAPLLIGHAANDAIMPPEMVERLHTALDAAGVTYEGEVYPAAHGWCVPGGPAYSEPAAEMAWSRMVRLFKVQLAA